MSSFAKIRRREDRAQVESLAAAVPVWRARLRTLQAPLPILQRLLAGAAFLAAGVPRAALAANTVSSPTLGNVVAASNGPTVFRFTPAGAVSVASGNGVRMSTGSAEFQVTINCSGNPCQGGPSLVTIQPVGSLVGRAEALSRFDVTMGTAQLVGSLPSPGSPYSFTIAKIGRNKSATFTIGGDFTVDGDDQISKSTGTASAQLLVTVSTASGGSATVATGTMTATVLRSPSMKILNNSTLDFGRIVRPSSGASGVLLPASTGTRLVTGNGVGLPTPTPSRVQLELSGEGHQTVSVSVPTVVVLTSTVGSVTSSLNMTTSNTAQGTQQLSGTAGGAGSLGGGTLDFYVGGAFTISSTTPTGVYQGNIVVTAQYN